MASCHSAYHCRHRNLFFRIITSRLVFFKLNEGQATTQDGTRRWYRRRQRGWRRRLTTAPLGASRDLNAGRPSPRPDANITRNTLHIYDVIMQLELTLSSRWCTYSPYQECNSKSFHDLGDTRRQRFVSIQYEVFNCKWVEFLNYVIITIDCWSA